MATAELTEIQTNLADSLWEARAFKTGSYRLKLHETHPDAPESPYYISMREKDVIPGTYESLMTDVAMSIRRQNLELFRRGEIDPKQRINHILGIPKAGDRMAEILGLVTDISVLTMDKVEDEKGRHISSVIHGKFKPSDRVFGIDDLVTGADTKFEFHNGVTDNGLVLVHIGVALDREQGGMQKLRDAGINVSAVLTVSDLLNHYLSSNYINNSTYDQIRTYIDSQK